MEEKKESFVFYRSFYEAISNIKEDNKRLEIYEAIFELALKNNEIELKDNISKVVMGLIKPQILANNKRYKDGLKGGRPKTKTTGFDKEKPNVNENDNVNENENDNNILSSSSTPNTEIYKEIIDYLNQKLNTNYKYTTKATQSKIKARMNEGFSLNDFKTVIDKMTDEWLDDENMSKYLRPETLFGTKFESYLNKTPKPKKVDPYYNPEAEKEFYESDYYKEHVLGIKVPKKRVIEEGDPFAEYYDN